MKNLNIIIVFFIVILLSACAETKIPSYTTSSLYVFGDSLSDVGNARIASAGLLPDKNYYNGRFSNGPNYADILADKLNTPLKASRSFGSNYAFAGARSNEVNAQVSNYKQNVENTANPAALYIVWSGNNDLLEILLDNKNNMTIDSIITPIEDAIRKLALIGATRILIPNQVNLANIPRIIEIENELPGTQATATTLTTQFNTALDEMLNRLSNDAGITILKFDTFSLFKKVVANPGEYNLSNVSARCYIKNALTLELTGDEIICDSKTTYLFWDDIHPSHIGHTIIANEMLQTIEAIPQ